MGRYFIRSDGEIGPSKEYLRNNRSLRYQIGDVFNDDYDVENDDAILYCSRICDRCGKTFTLYDAMSEYADRIDWPEYSYNFIGEYCGNCAADITEENFKL